MRWQTVGGLAAVAMFAASSGGAPVEPGPGESADGILENRIDDIIEYGPGRDGQGCTPHFWKQAQHFGSWPVNIENDFGDAFQGFCFSGDIVLEEPSGIGACSLGLLEALRLRGGGAAGLTRNAAAAWLNAGSTVDFVYDRPAVESILEAARDARTFEVALEGLARANEAGCPLGRSDFTY